MPKVTIIISAHNDSDWLRESINSALKQSFDDFEIILSSDGNMDLIRYAKLYNIGWSYCSKSNYATAFNLAANRAKGEWIKGLHYDDWLCSSCLYDLYNSRADSDLIYANAIEFNENEKYTYKSPANITIKDLLPIITNPVHGGTLLIKRDTFLKVGGLDTNLKQTEDYDLYLNILSNGYKMQYCNEIVTHFRLHPGQTSQNNRESEQVKEKIYLQTKYKPIWSVNDAY